MSADLPFRMNELGEALAVEGDALLGEGEVVVAGEEGGKHAGRLALGVGFEDGERGAVQFLDPSGYLGGDKAGQSAEAFTVGGPWPPRHAAVPGRPGWKAAGWW